MFRAQSYDKIYSDRSKEVEFLLKHLKGKTVLDIGGGTGAISEALNKKGFECVNVEPDFKMARKSMFKGVNTTYWSAEDFDNSLMLGKKKYDNAIMMFDVFNFLTDPDKALENISKLLKGRLIFSYWNYEIRKSGWEFNWKLKRLSYKKWYVDRVEIDFWFPFYHEKHTMKVYKTETICDLLDKHGFKVVEKIDDYYTTIIVAEI